MLTQVQQAVPQLLLPVLPHLCPLLEAEDESKRLAAVEVAGHLFSKAEADIAGEYPELLSFFLRRFLDQKVSFAQAINPHVWAIRRAPGGGGGGLHRDSGLL